MPVDALPSLHYTRRWQNSQSLRHSPVASMFLPSACRRSNTRRCSAHRFANHHLNLTADRFSHLTAGRQRRLCSGSPHRSKRREPQVFSTIRSSSRNRRTVAGARPQQQEGVAGPYPRRPALSSPKYPPANSHKRGRGQAGTP